MDVRGIRRLALPYARLVPATLLPPEDPTDGRSSGRDADKRTLRDWFVDVVLFLAAVGIGALFFASAIDAEVGTVSQRMRLLDLGCGALACVSLWWRRRWPVSVAVCTALLSIASAAASPASVVGLFGAAVHRRTGTAITIAVLNILTSTVFTIVRPQHMSVFVSTLINVGAAGAFLAWGMFVRARRQLIWTLRERAERAEAEQRMLADQARSAERTRIAREMHDVLAHRISMIALHAGGLQVRPDLPTEQVRDTAELLRSTAQQALEELRGVIGVLRTDSGTAEVAPPQPTLRDIPRLVEDTRRAGTRIEFQMTVPVDAQPPESIGRDAYRIVQEALTNVAKHARGTATTVHVSGAPGEGLHVDVRNSLLLGSGEAQLPGAGDAQLPGAGAGLLGLQERVTLAGGHLEHGPTDDGEFVVDARLAWR